MANVSGFSGRSTSTGGGGNGKEYTASEMTTDFKALGAGSHPVPAGAYMVSVQNKGVENITVNGEVVPAGESWRIDSIVNEVTSEQSFVPALAIIVPAGGAATVVAYRPS